MSGISESLDSVLGNMNFSHEHSESISALNAKLEDIKKDLSATQFELVDAINKMYAQLGTTIRKMQPDLVVSLQKKGCVVGFRTRCIICRADPATEKWDFSSDEFGTLFARRHGGVPIDTPLEEVAKNVVDFFASHFESLAIR